MKIIQIIICSLLIFLINYANLAFASPKLLSPKEVKIGKDSMLYDNEEKKLIIFIHGLGGDKNITWLNTDTNLLWPRALANDSNFSGYDILNFDYQTYFCNFAFKAPLLSIHNIAERLPHFLNILKLIHKKNYQEISFLTHSMGGIVLIDFILNHWETIQSEYPITNVVMLSPPAMGNKHIKNLKNHCQNNKQTEGLQHDKNSDTNKLLKRWKAHWTQHERPFPIFIGMEQEGRIKTPLTLMYSLITGESSIVNQSDGKDIKRNLPFIFQEDHISISKPPVNNEPLYLIPSLWVTRKESNIYITKSFTTRKKLIFETFRKIENNENIDRLKEIINSENLNKAFRFLDSFDDKEQDFHPNIPIEFFWGQLHELKGNSQAAEENYFTSKRNIDKPFLLNFMAGYFNQKKSYSQAIDFFLVSETKSIIAKDFPQLAATRNKIGQAYQSQGNYSKAITYFKAALEALGVSDIPNIFSQKFCKNKPKEFSTFINNLGIATFLNRSTHYKYESELYLRGALDCSNIISPKNHPDLGIRHNNLGDFYFLTGEFNNAISNYKKAVNIYGSNIKNNHKNYATSLNNLGLAQVRHPINKVNKGLYGENNIDSTKDVLKEARHNFETALAIDKNMEPLDYSALARDYSNLGLALLYLGPENNTKAENYFKKANTIYPDIYPENHPEYAIYWNNMAGIKHIKGIKSQAIYEIDIAINILENYRKSNKNIELKYLGFLDSVQRTEKFIQGQR